MAKRKTSGWTLAGIGAEHGAEAAAVLVTYLGELRAIRRSGAAVDETSYDPALAGLFTTVGQQLKPKVRCVMNLRNTGAGMPDGGLFTAAQFERQSDGAINAGNCRRGAQWTSRGRRPTSIPSPNPSRWDGICKLTVW